MPSSDVKLAFCNIRGLESNIDSVHQFLQDEKPDLLFLSETQVSNYDIDRFWAPHYYLEESFVFKHGVCVFVHEHIGYRRLRLFEIQNKWYQTIVVKVSLVDCSIIFVSLYRSPSNECPDDFFELLQNKVDDLLATYPQSELVILGDFNVHNTSWLIYSDPNRDGMIGQAAEELCDSHSLLQLVNGPTRCPDRETDQAYLLDLYLTSIANLTDINITAAIGNSDHYLIRSRIQIPKPQVLSAPPRTVWHYDRANWVGLSQFLKEFSWNSLCFPSDDVNHAAQVLTDAILLGMDKFIPHSLIVPKRQTWFSRESQIAVIRKKTCFSQIYENTVAC